LQPNPCSQQSSHDTETGPLATSWHINKFLNPIGDGAVLSVLHLNGYPIRAPGAPGIRSASAARSAGGEVEVMAAGHHGAAGLDPPQGDREIGVRVTAGDAGGGGHITGQSDIEHGEQIAGVVTAIGG